MGYEMVVLNAGTGNPSCRFCHEPSQTLERHSSWDVPKDCERKFALASMPCRVSKRASLFFFERSRFVSNKRDCFSCATPHLPESQCVRRRSNTSSQRLSRDFTCCFGAGAVEGAERFRE